MDEKKQKRLMNAVFMYMMSKGMFRDQLKMSTALKSVVHVLEIIGDISVNEKDNCLLYFFQEYSQGCASPIPDSYIKSSIIPNVYQYGQIDFPLGLSIVTVAKNNI